LEGFIDASKIGSEHLNETIMKKLTLVLLGIILLYGNCKDAVETPEPTPTKLSDLTLAGKYYFACLIDGVHWANLGNHVEPGGWTKVSVPNLQSSLFYLRSKDSTKIQIQGNMYTNTKDDDLSIEFACKGYPTIMEVYSIDLPKFPKRADLTIKFVPNGNGKSFGRFSNPNAYVTNPKLENSANITFVKIDTVAKIMSGVFYAKVFPNQGFSSSNSTVIPKIITQGRFDVKYQPYPLIK
jgi:hypothetical protein